MNSLILTEKQQEVLWLRYGRQASISQIAAWLNITRRAVLARLHNARRRAARAGFAFPEKPPQPTEVQRRRIYAASQISAPLGGITELDEL